MTLARFAAAASRRAFSAVRTWPLSLDSRNHTAHCIEPIGVFPAAFFHVKRQAFHEVAAGKWINRIRKAGFMRNDLLRAQCNSRGVLGWKGERFIERIRMQRLRSSDH